MKTSLLLIPILLFTSISFSAEKPTTKATNYPAMTTDMRSKMAEMHQQMATCLKSEKTFEECHNSMTNSCREFGQMMPMKGPGMMPGHPGKMHGQQGMMGGYPGMMTGFCGDQWINETPKETKPKTK